jgi:Cft2 family RNA processing exonuclease
MRLRVGGRRQETILGFGEAYTADFGCEVKLHPAGHIFGSAMFHATTDKGSLLYTGDFKLRPSLAAEGCATPQADVVIMETTFGLPRYAFPPQEKIDRDIVEFCRQALADNVAPVIFAYSLGKTQELLQIVGGAGLPVMLHTHGYRMTVRYAELGMKLPSFALLDTRAYAGHVIIAPPGQSTLDWIHPKRTAIATGWAMDSGAMYQSRADAAFPLSDHADFPDLLAFVDKVKPKVVYTVHGFAKEFAATLRARGIEAWALGQQNQMDLALR